jgi:hypothetical protein
MPYATFKEMNDQIAELSRRAENQNSQPVVEPSSEEALDDFIEATRAAIRVIQFTIAELDPATVRGWPWSALRQFGTVVKQLPMDIYTHEFADECVRFAQECENVDRYREKRHNEAKALLGIDPS